MTKVKRLAERVSNHDDRNGTFHMYKHSIKKTIPCEFFPWLQPYKNNHAIIQTKQNIQQYYNIEISLEEGKIREVTGKKRAEDRGGLIIKSLFCLSEVSFSFLFRKLLLR